MKSTTAILASVLIACSVGCGDASRGLASSALLTSAVAQSLVPEAVTLPDVKEMEALVMQTAPLGRTGGGLSVTTGAASAVVAKGAPAPKAARSILPR